MEIKTKEDIWLWLQTINSLKLQTCAKLMANFDNPRSLWQASKTELLSRGKIENKEAEKIYNSKNSFDLDKLKENLKYYGIKCVYWGHPEYPAFLKEIYDPPKVLYYQGSLPNDWSLGLAVVGARKMTPYGKMAALKILPPLIRSGFIIISGLAFGIDSEAHRLTLANNGKTIAVIGSGLDPQNLYPAQNQTLANEIVKTKGAVISEFPPCTAPLPYHFPLRNRIIAGLSKGTLIIEASAKSGSLITAKSALSENREIMAVPGPINTINSVGALNLIKEGAHLVKEASDVLSIYSLKSLDKNETLNTYNHNPLLRFLTNEPAHIDTISKRFNLTTSEVSARLSQLEIDGLVKNVGGNHYIIIKYI